MAQDHQEVQVLQEVQAHQEVQVQAQVHPEVPLAQSLVLHTTPAQDPQEVQAQAQVQVAVTTPVQAHQQVPQAGVLQSSTGLSRDLSTHPHILLRQDQGWPHTYRSIKISDRALADHIVGDSPPLLYGGAQVSKEEAQLLKLHPNMALFPSIKMRDFKLELERSMAKQRWWFMGNQPLATTTQYPPNHSQPDPTHNSSQPPNPPTGPVIDFFGKRVTDLKSNKEVIMPKQADPRRETEIMALHRVI